MHWLGNISSQIHPKEPGFPFQAHSVQLSLLLFSLPKKPQLFYIRTSSVCGPPPGKDLVQSRSCELIPRHIPQAVPCWVQDCPQFPLAVPECPALVTGWHVSISYPGVISYWGVLSKEWRHRPAEQWASSYDNFPLQPGWRPLIHFPQAKQLLRGNAALCRTVTSAQAMANSTILNHPDCIHCTPSFKIPTKQRVHWMQLRDPTSVSCSRFSGKSCGQPFLLHLLAGRYLQFLQDSKVADSLSLTWSTRPALQPACAMPR